jgi:nucleoside-diphosphate-sugar epimerase
MSTYLVTGAKGFIGTALSRRLADAGHVVYGVDIDDSLTSMIPVVDGVFHLAGHASAQAFEENPLLAGADLGAMMEVCRAALEHHKPMVCASSAFSLNATTLYGLSRNFVEQVAWLFARRGLDIHIARFFNVYGPGQENAVTYKGSFILDTARAMLRGSQGVVQHSLAGRDFVFIEDVLDDLVTMMAEPGDRRVWDVGSGSIVSLQETAEIIAKLVHSFPLTRLHLGLARPPEGDSRSDIVAPYYRPARLPAGTNRTALWTGLAKTIAHIRVTELVLA